MRPAGSADFGAAVRQAQEKREVIRMDRAARRKARGEARRHQVRESLGNGHF